ncbi:ABC transporter ATP-binding protein [Myroides odoratimimus]|uniref:ABC transporter ATP-binding protein n=1 Tax=Myroides odoratimimus TaxID=76832 RepID=UPI0025751C1A|nr:ABC transporter ATP-binding protein [Myroides odoratimimus]MDM1399312.1 ABC transporter ATP-binding protein [Myroides odoratimimus]MDM1462527.1 ABC transporter ATP-binding protein [Myroides odoratimimus]MDM1472528.1 ABC transporter ATP-binding protein [Myroides odoratimimus]MDM1504806.1 ABC transporter ATP-binding protein [Myroides odoratimimus]MDM1515442.1 ABC transporter ATP-binding protein [Myroides odoratimimus]
MKENIPILSVKDLQIDFLKEKSWNTIIKSSSFDIYANEILGVVGESGSGKSVTSLALMGLLPREISRISSGNIVFEGNDITHNTDSEFRLLRGAQISMIFQEPMSALNPSITCGEQVAEILREHTSLRRKALREEVLRLFDRVKLPNPNQVYTKYPHQISGGQKQRVMIAMAVACKPKLLIADEPTTALDVTVQNEIINLLKDLQRDNKMSILFISHDLNLVSSISDRILVMYKGDIVEQGKSTEVFNNPQDMYTKALVASRPSLTERLKRLSTIGDFLNNKVVRDVVTTEDRKDRLEKLYSNAPLLEIRNVFKDYIINGGLFKKGVFHALQDISFNVYEGETLGLVGESGCGKSTLGNVILQLDRATKGQIFYKGQDITKLSSKAFRVFRKDIQIIFQDPYSSLNPRLTVGEAILEPMKVHKIGSSDADRKERVIEILYRVGLDESVFSRYPHEFSGGQRQRIGIARTIAVQPKLIICDESVSALDISVQAQVLNLLNDLKDKYNFTYIFISHDLSVVKYMSDQVMVMNKGKIEEIGEADELYAHPKTEYTKGLISSIPN